MVNIVVKEAVYRLVQESVPRIKKCFVNLTDEEIWNRPNNNLVSLGNLILHLNGNVRQYILFGLGGQSDKRKRQSEFDHSEIIPKDKLLSDLDQLMVEVQEVLKNLDDDNLTKLFTVQGMELTGFGIIMHVVEHFSYHVGQITWHTKLLKEMDMKYYAGQDLDITG